MTSTFSPRSNPLSTSASVFLLLGSPRNRRHGTSVHGALAAAKPKPQQEEGTPPPHHSSRAVCFRTFLTFWPRLISQREEPWLAASLRPSNFLPGLAIGFLLGLLLDLSSSWRPKLGPAPAPPAAPVRGTKSKRASGSTPAAGGEELKMVK
jgi:hypothetical protein